VRRFTISEASKEIGCHPSTLRNYEEKGLFKPRRDRNGFRYFTEEDVSKLVQIRYPERYENL
jgi:MerR family transcriptional regulator/heat shock protein HspR